MSALMTYSKGEVVKERCWMGSWKYMSLVPKNKVQSEDTDS
jgi:hypothetical protein